MKLKSLLTTASAFLAMFAGFARAVPAADPPVVSAVAVTAAGLSSPIRAAVDASGVVLVSDPRSGGLVRLDLAGKALGTIPVAGSPQGVAVTAEGKLLVSQGDSVAVLSASGAQLGLLGSGAGQFKMANGITVDAAGNIYVTDSIDNSVLVFKGDGSFSFRFGSTGTSDSQFFMPTGITYEKASGLIAVVDTNNGRIQFFNTSGVFQKSIGAIGSGPLKFTSPQAIAFEYGTGSELLRMYIVDSFQSSIQVLDASGGFLGYLGSYGSKPGQFVVPSDVVFDQARQRLMVVNGFGNVTSFAIAGQGPADVTPPALAVVGFEPVINETTYTLKGTVEQWATVSVFVGDSQVGGAAKIAGAAWSYELTGLSVGANTIRITATDLARNVTTQTLTLTVNPANVYTVTATAAAGGGITPTTTLKSGQSKKFVISATAGYHVADVIVDGVSKGPISSYTFSSVTDNHTIEARFANTYTITAAVVAGEGTIGPVTPAVIPQGDDVLMTFTPAVGWHVDTVTVDGARKAAKTTFTLNNVSGNHAVAVGFAKNTYKVTATKSGRGTVSPATAVIEHGKPHTITLTPGTGYHVSDIIVDGVAKGEGATWSFGAVDAPHTVKALFAINTYTLNSAAYPAEGGTITAGATIRYGTSKTFTIKPKAGYTIADVKVDGVSVGAKKTVKIGPLTNAAAKDYTIEAYFSSTAAVAVSALSDGRNAASRVQNLTGPVTDPSARITINGEPVAVAGGSFSAAVSLADGANVVTITETAANGTSVTGTRTIVYQEGAPALAVATPADGTRTDSGIVTFNGTVAPGASVVVEGNVAAVNGTSWTATLNLPAGMNTVEVVATDASGASAAVKRTIIVDPDTPAVAVTSPVEDFVTKASEVVVEGTNGDATVSATVNGAAVSVMQSGDRFTITVPLAVDGPYVIAVKATDATGKSSTAVRTIIRDTTPPVVGFTSTAPVLSGTMEGAVSITVRDASGVLGKAAVHGSSWSFDLSGRMYDAATLAVIAVDAAGNVTEAAP